MRTERQLSAGGVVVKRGEGGPEVALIAVGEPPRWQLPKGIVERGESPEATAVREVREETGVDASPLEALDPIDYWYVGTERDGSRVRYHKEVRFYLMRYVGGSVDDHDHEVREARWIPLAEAADRLAFENERRLVRLAATRLGAGSQ